MVSELAITVNLLREKDYVPEPEWFTVDNAWTE